MSVQVVAAGKPAEVEAALLDGVRAGWTLEVTFPEAPSWAAHDLVLRVRTYGDVARAVGRLLLARVLERGGDAAYAEIRAKAEVKGREVRGAVKTGAGVEVFRWEV